jgi:hypothetical protein
MGVKSTVAAAAATALDKPATAELYRAVVWAEVAAEPVAAWATPLAMLTSNV